MTGCVELTAAGNRRHPRTRREAGSEFAGELRITAIEYDVALEALRTLIPPEGVETYINGDKLPNGGQSQTCTRRCLQWRRTSMVRWAKQDGELEFEQKVPVNMDRDNVPPSYLRELRTLIMNGMHSQVTQDDANSAWAKEALGDPKIQDAAVKSLVQARFGDKVVSYDPSDPEANKLAVSKGYQVIHGGTLSGDEWNNVKRAGTLLPAGKVTPSPKPYSSGGRPEIVVDPSDWTTEMSGTAHYARELARCLIDRDIEVSICRAPSVSWLANYGPGLLTLNIGRLKNPWFSEIGSVAMNELLIHEFGHEYSGDHLSEAYHDALCNLGARMTTLALAMPSVFDANCYVISAGDNRSSRRQLG